jgi:hypothetical protein
MSHCHAEMARIGDFRGLRNDKPATNNPAVILGAQFGLRTVTEDLFSTKLQIWAV